MENMRDTDKTKEQLIAELSALRKEKSGLQQYLDIAGVVLVALNADQTAAFINKEGRKVLGVEENEIIDGNWFDTFIPKRVRDEVKAFFKRLIAKGSKRIEYFENPVLTRSGKERLFAWRTTVLTDETGKVVGTLGSGEDITEHKSAEEALRKAVLRADDERARSEAVIAAIGCGISIQDNDFKILYQNQAHKNMIGDHAGELCYEAYERREHICEGCPIAMAFADGKIHTMERSVMTDKGLLNVEITASPLRDAAGNITAGIEVVRDITERKRFEQRLRHVQKMETIGTLTGGISHEFNNIITAILGYGEFLQEGIEKDNPLRTYVDIIVASVRRAADLTNSLLTYSRKQIIHRKLLSLNEIIKKMEGLITKLIGEDIELRIELLDNLAVMADAGQIEQVLINLVTNAKDAMMYGGALTVRVEPAEMEEAFIASHGFGKPGRYALVSVKDTGTGMDEATRRKIFDPFFTTKEVGRGAGLGLAMVYGIVKKHDGYIDVLSMPGKGTTFKIYLPSVKEDVEKRRAPRVLSTTCTETILVAEDDNEVRTLITSLLEKTGYKVIAAVDGEDAIQKATANKETIHLVLLDVVMPRKNGKEAYVEIKRTIPGVKALFMSGYAADVMQEEGDFEEEFNFISKPASPQDLLRKVRDVLDGREERF